MQTLEKVKAIYESYLNADRNLSHHESYRKKGGLFGSLIRGIKDTTLEEEFTKELKKTIKEYQESEREKIEEEEVYALLSYIYGAQDELVRDERCYYMFASVHSLTRELIPGLLPEHAESLLADYRKKKEAFSAMPAYGELLELLEKQSLRK